MKTKRITSIALACTFTLGFLPSAVAGNEADAHFKMMDANGDGKITRAEHAAGARKMFSQCDANRDGIVTAAEMDASAHTHGRKVMKDEMSSAEKIREIDQNGDGQLTTAEHEAGTEKMFGRMDTDKDGSLSKEECKEAMKLMKKPA